MDPLGQYILNPLQFARLQQQQQQQQREQAIAQAKQRREAFGQGWRLILEALGFRFRFKSSELVFWVPQ